MLDDVRRALALGGPACDYDAAPPGAGPLFLPQDRVALLIEQILLDRRQQQGLDQLARDLDRVVADGEAAILPAEASIFGRAHHDIGASVSSWAIALGLSMRTRLCCRSWGLNAASMRGIESAPEKGLPRCPRNPNEAK